MRRKNHITDPIGDVVVWLCCDVIKELAHSSRCVHYVCCLLGPDGAEGDHNLFVNSATVIE